MEGQCEAGSKKMECKSVDWIHLDHDRVQWPTLVNTVM